MDLTDCELDDLLRTADPFPDAAARAPEVVAALDDLLQRVTAHGARVAGEGRRRRPSRKLVATVAATGLVAIGGVAAAASGTFSPVSTTAPDFASSVRAATVSLPLPPGDSIDNYIKLWEQGPTGDLDRSQLVDYFSYDAVCAWQGYWLQEHDAGHAAKAVDALTILRQIPTWPYGADSTTRAVYRSVASAAAAGDAGPVRQSWTANCDGVPRAWASK